MKCYCWRRSSWNKYQYLQGTGSGVRALSILSVSSSFQWTAQQVVKLGNQRNTLVDKVIITSNAEVDVISIKHLLLQHQKLVITSVDEKDVQRIHIQRSNVSFDISKILKVKFIGESAIDDGGPRRVISTSS